MRLLGSTAIAGCGHTEAHAALLRAPQAPTSGKVELYVADQAPPTRPFYELDSEVAADRLNPAQLAVYAIYLADFEILNGGFSQFWLNAGALGPELVPAAERVGSAELAAIFREAEAVWPGGKVPRDRAKREALLDQLDGERLAAVDERYAATQYQRKTALANVLGPYIRGNTRQFVIG